MDQTLIKQMEMYFHIALPGSAYEPMFASGTWSGSDLLDPDKAKAIVREAKELFRCETDTVAASLLIRQWTPPVAVWAAMTKANAELGVALDMLTLKLDAKHGILFLLRQPIFAPGPIEPAARAEWRSRLSAAAMRDHAVPVLSALRKAGPAPAKTLWAHIAYNAHTMFEFLLEHESEEAAAARMRDDLAYVTAAEAPADWEVGAANPLSVAFRTYAVKHEAHEPGEEAHEHTMYLRSQCCLNYRREGERYCSTCPLITDEQRELLLVQAHSHDH